MLEDRPWSLASRVASEHMLIMASYSFPAKETCFSRNPYDQTPGGFLMLYVAHNILQLNGNPKRKVTALARDFYM